MNPILSREKHVKELESQYYREFSSERYTSVEEKRLKFLLPFEKEYIRKKRSRKGEVLNYPKVIDAVIENTLKIKRFDLLSYYQDHNNSPSVRSLHTARLLFIINGQIYYYSMYDDQFLRVTHDKTRDSVFDDDNIYIVGLSDVLNLTRYYGEFSLYASILDAGHLLFNVKNTLVRRGIDFHIYKQFPSKHVFKQADIDPRATYLSFVLAIHDDKRSHRNEQSVRWGYDTRLSLAHDELHSTRFLRDILNQYNEGTGMEAELVKVGGTPYLDIPEKLMRNSAHTTVGNNNFTEMFEHFSPVELLDIINRSYQVFSNPYTDYCLLAKQDGQEYVYRSDFTMTEREIDYRSIMYNEYKFFDMDSYRFVLVCFTKTKHQVENGLVDHIISSGEIMQLAAAYASQVGYAFRPMKNHHDHYLKEILSLDSDTEINFMGVVCNSPIQQLSAHL